MHLTDWLVELQGHKRRVAYIEWHPIAENILFSAGFDYLVSQISNKYSILPCLVFSILRNNAFSRFIISTIVCSKKVSKLLVPELIFLSSPISYQFQCILIWYCGQLHYGRLRAYKLVYIYKIKTFVTDTYSFITQIKCKWSWYLFGQFNRVVVRH